ncbi:MAG: P27 family phage terminase small subunit [Magnetococcales bacterium]|nr:P27 family phage terminase small subunit [Magnetococcales bacterium]
MQNLPGQGRPPLPTAIKELKGTARKHRIRSDEPTPIGVAVCPANIENHPRAKAWWDKITSAAPQGTYTSMDMPSLSMFCMSMSLASEAWEEVVSKGIMLIDRFETKENPYLRIFNREIEMATRLASHLGLSPSARTRLGVMKNTSSSDRKPIEQDPWDSVVG